MRPTRGTLLLFACAPVFAALGLGCEEKKVSESVPSSEAGTDKYVAADPKLARALQSATSESAAPDSGPPPDGVFAPGVAEQRHPRGTPTKVDLAAAGAEPRISLRRTGDASADPSRAFGYGPAILEFGMQMGRSALPTIDLNLVLGPSKKPDGASGWLSAEVRRATPAKEQFGQLPAGSERDIASLEGTDLRVQLTSDGLAGDEQVELGRSAPPELDRIAQNAADALLLFTVPVPPSPVGVGGQWIAETRMTWVGVDVLAYRAYRVKSIDGDRVDLSLVVQAYAADKETHLQGVPKGATLEQFEAQAQGEVELLRGEVVPQKAELDQRMTLFFQPPQEGQISSPPGQGAQPRANMMVAKFDSQATFLRSEDLRAASAR